VATHSVFHRYSLLAVTPQVRLQLEVLIHRHAAGLGHALVARAASYGGTWG